MLKVGKENTVTRGDSWSRGREKFQGHFMKEQSSSPGLLGK